MSSRRKHHLYLCGALLLCATTVANAGGRERLDAFYKEVQSLRGEFTQTVLDPRMKVGEEAQGTLALQRPGKFRWDYKTPYHQLIVADGNKVWIYDIELEQVTVKRLDEAVGNTPAQLLSSGESLEKNFNITEEGKSGEFEWVELTPKQKDSSFEKVRLGFDQRDLRTMELKDNFGQTTRLQFSHLERNPKLVPSRIDIKPRPGADVSRSPPTAMRGVRSITSRSRPVSPPRKTRARSAKSCSTKSWPAARCAASTRAARPFTIRYPRCTKPCAARRPMRRCTGSRACSTAVPIRSTSRAAWCAWRMRTSATPTRAR